MGLRTTFILLFMLSAFRLSNCDKPYKVINFKIPQAIWRQALNPTPVLKSPVTITVPINVQDNGDEAEDLDEVDDEEQELVDPVVNDEVVNDEVVPQVVQDPVPVVNSPTPPAVVTQAPLLQDEVITEGPPVPGQVIRLPCQCRNRQCGCCTGSFMDRFSMKACGNITFIPEDFVFDVKMSMNNRTVIRRRVSASDPPPICFNPRRAPFVQVCAEISNIQIRNRNAHACFEINADIGGFPVYSAPFRCFNFGASGLTTGKKPRPVSSSGPKPVSLFGDSNKDNDDGGGDFIENTVFGEGGLFGGGGEGGLFGGGGEGGLFGGGGEGGLFGGGGGDGGSSNDDGPFDGVGDAIGDFLDLD